MTYGSHVTATKKKAREKDVHAQNLLPVRATSGQGLFRLRDCHFRSNYPIRADIAQFPVAHAQNILPDRFTSGHVTDVTSGHVNSGHAQWSDPPHAPPQILICPSPYTTDIFTDVVNICVTNDHEYVSFVVMIIMSFIHDFSHGL